MKLKYLVTAIALVFFSSFAYACESCGCSAKKTEKAKVCKPCGKAKAECVCPKKTSETKVCKPCGKAKAECACPKKAAKAKQKSSCGSGSCSRK